MIQNSLWEEKYRPVKIEDFITDDHLRDKLMEYIDKNDIPHLLLYGEAGSGKNSLVNVLVKSINCDHLYVNASEETGVDVIRTKVKNFASVASFKKLKIAHLDECDKLSEEAQDALKAMIETYSVKTRFVFTTNHYHKISKELKSRCTEINIKPDSKINVAGRLSYILDEENIEYDVKDIAMIVKAKFPDIRACIRTMQHNIKEGKLELIDLEDISSLSESFLQLLMKPGKNTFNDIRQLISDNSIRNFSFLYRLLYNNFLIFKSPEDAVIILAEHEYQDYFVPDKEICFMACISKILKLK